ncbi:MAG: hypothetical protein JXR21_02700 [Candidatus Marinimicrobia bacterium]|nr:hypothetical protein [Candidatus Neomarinimicrobiota bacterium]
MKRIKTLMLITIIAMILSSCATLTVVHNKQRDKLMKKANRYRVWGGIAEIGEAKSQREDIARDKARTDAYIKIGQAIESRIDGIAALYVKEEGSDKASEITELFEKTAEVIINTTVQGIFPVDETITLSKGVYTAYALYAITPRSVNTRLMKELKEQQPEIYERFVISKTSGDLEEEVLQYEKEIVQ